MEAEPTVDADRDLLDGIGPALSRMRRRTAGSDLGLNILLNVVGDAAAGITVTQAAQELGISQPAASRRIASAVNAGLVRRTVSQDDGRQSVLELTPDGRARRDHFAAEQRMVFEKITRSWDAAEQMRFAELVIRYAHDAAAYKGE